MESIDYYEILQIERDSSGRYSVAADLQAWAPGQLRTALVDATLPLLKDLNREFRETMGLTNVKIMECGVKPAFYSMWSPSVIIRPGQNTIAKQLSIAILGQKIATLRRHEVSLDRKNEGVRLPSVSIRRGAGLGVTWQNGVPLTNSTYTDFRFSAFPKRRPSASLTISRSLRSAYAHRKARPWPRRQRWSSASRRTCENFPALPIR